MNKIALKRLKRKREIARRVRCHKNKMACKDVHPTKIKRVSLPSPKKKLSFWKRLLKFLHLA